jgi:3-oxoacyl-[acyl-carrier-protein] synthase II
MGFKREDTRRWRCVPLTPTARGLLLILESLPHAQTRGARIYAKVLGYGNSNDAYHMIAPDPEGEGAALAVRRVLESAGVGIEAVDYINAHGMSTLLGDAAETKAVKTVFGGRPTKSPSAQPTINYEKPDPECDLDYVPNEARQAEVKVAVSNSFGLGDQNAVLALGVDGVIPYIPGGET